MTTKNPQLQPFVKKCNERLKELEIPYAERLVNSIKNNKKEDKNG